ncbi:MAG: hypothetical protein Q7S95_02715 [bacterium]|nr:hypothetical protein [bacterium]
MKSLNSKISLAIVVLLLVPQVAFAAWWNPLSWSIWSIFISTHKIQPIQIGAMNEASSTPKESPKQNPETATEGSKKEDLKPRTQTATLPSTPVVKESPTATSQPTQLAQNSDTKISSTALEGELLKFLNEQLNQQMRSNLDYYQKTIFDMQSLYQTLVDISARGKQNCTASYNSKAEYAKDDAQQQKTANAEVQRGFASSPAISQNIDAQLVRDLEDIEDWYTSCLAKYQAEPSISTRLSKVSSQLGILQGRVSSGGIVSVSEVSSIKNEITSISKALGTAAGISGSVSLPTLGSQPSSITCTNNVTGFSCRDNFGSNAMRCTQSTPGYLNCTDSNFNSVSCQSNSTLGSLRCSW